MSILENNEIIELLDLLGNELNEIRDSNTNKNKYFKLRNLYTKLEELIK